MSNYLLRVRRELIKALAKCRIKKVSSNYLGMQLTVPVVNGVVNGGYMVPRELWMGDCLKAFIETRSGMVVDIGVNVGLYLVKLRVCSKDRQYIGFDPSPSCNMYTQELIRMNGFRNNKVFPLALSDEEGVAEFYASNLGDKTGTLIKEHKQGQNLDYSFDVITVIGDKIMQIIMPEEISVIKIDVEEAEIFVLRGLVETITKFRPYIYCEILFFEGDSGKKKSGVDIYEFIVSKDYKVLGISCDAKELNVVEDINDIGVKYDQEYIFCPNELLGNFEASIKNNSSKVAIAL